MSMRLSLASLLIAKEDKFLEEKNLTSQRIDLLEQFPSLPHAVEDEVRVETTLLMTRVGHDAQRKKKKIYIIAVKFHMLMA